MVLTAFLEGMDGLMGVIKERVRVRGLRSPGKKATVPIETLNKKKGRKHIKKFRNALLVVRWHFRPPIRRELRYSRMLRHLVRTISMLLRG